MTSLLIAIFKTDDLQPLLILGKKIANALELKLIVATFYNTNTPVNQENQSDQDVVFLNPPASDFFTSIDKILEESNFDVSLIILSPMAFNNKKRKNVTSFFFKCRQFKVPYLVMPDKFDSNWEPHNIIFPLCLKEGEKETSAWAGFLARYHNSNLSIIYPAFKNQDYQKKVWIILVFIQRLFDKSNVRYQSLAKGDNKRETLKAAIDRCNKTGNSLLIMPATRYKSPEYYFTGSPEYKIIKNRGNTPVLFVNPRHDLYVPCG